MLLCQSIDVLSRFILQLCDRLWSEKELKFLLSASDLTFKNKKKEKYSKIWNAKDQFLAKKILVFGKTICKNFFGNENDFKMAIFFLLWQKNKAVIHKITYERLKMVIWDGGAISNRSGTVFTKLYFLHNLLMSLISRSVWLWQVFPALCNVTL